MTFKTRGQHSIFQNCIQRICMDKASVARVCIMFNYKKYLFFKNLQDYVYLLCIFFQFALSFQGWGWDKRCVCLAPLEDLIRALQFPFLEVTLPFLVLLCLCWPWASCLEFPALDQEQGSQVLTKYSGLLKTATGSFVASVHE